MIYGTKQYITKTIMSSGIQAGEYISTGPKPRRILKGKNPRLVRKAGEPKQS